MEITLITFPCEIISYIIKFNDIKDLFNILNLCKYIYNIVINDVLLWESFLIRDFKYDYLNFCSNINPPNFPLYQKCYLITKLLNNKKFKIKNINGITDLWNLQQLCLEHNKIQEIPKEIGQLGNLQGLYLDNNQVQEIQKEIGQLHNLQELYLYNNQIQEIPKEIGQL